MFTNNFRKSIYSNRMFFFKKSEFLLFLCFFWGDSCVFLLEQTYQRNLRFSLVLVNKTKMTSVYCIKDINRIFLPQENTTCLHACQIQAVKKTKNPRHTYLRRKKNNMSLVQSLSIWPWFGLYTLEFLLYISYLLVLWDKKGSLTQYVLRLTSFCFSSLSSPQTHLFSGPLYFPPLPALFAVISLTSERVSLFATTVVLLYPAHNF